MKIRKQTEARITVSRMASFGIRDGFKPTLRVEVAKILFGKEDA